MAKRRRYSDTNKTDSVRTQVTRHRDIIQTGVMLCIDPSSGSRNSNAGYALWDSGKLIQSGELFDEKSKRQMDIYERMRELADWLAEMDCADILVMEKIRGKAHTYLRWACGVTVAACRAPVVIEVSPMLWHRYAPPGYVKSDAGDAVEIGRTVYAVLEEQCGIVMI
jgi:hypothetical protein